MIGDWESAMAPRLTEPERTRLNPPKAPPRQEPPPPTSPSCARAGWLSTNHGHRRIDWCFAHGLSGCQSGVEPMRSGDIRPCPFSGKLLPRPLAEKNGHYPESHSWLLPVLNTGHARAPPPPRVRAGRLPPTEGSRAGFEGKFWAFEPSSFRGIPLRRNLWVPAKTWEWATASFNVDPPDPLLRSSPGSSALHAHAPTVTPAPPHPQQSVVTRKFQAYVEAERLPLRGCHYCPKPPR